MRDLPVSGEAIRRNRCGRGAPRPTVQTSAPSTRGSRLPNTLLRSATAKRISWSFRSICYWGTAMAVTHSYGCASISQNPVRLQAKSAAQ